MKENSLDNSRILDIWIWSNKKEVTKTAEYIFTQLLEKHKLLLKKDFNLSRLKNHLKLILTDLMVVHKEDPKRYIAFSRNKSDYVPTKCFKKIFLNPKYIAFLTDFLVEEGFIELHKGIYFEGYAKMSRMRATQKLLRHFRNNKSDSGVILRRQCYVVMRNNKKQDIDFDTDTLEAKLIMRNAWRINQYLKEYEISLDVTSIPPKILAEYRPDIFNRYTKYHRIFNNSSFNCGGRFYSHWSQFIKREMREHILINGGEVVELDYSCLHITLLYALENITPPEGDLYKLNNISSDHREIIKKSFNIAINSENHRSAVAAINLERREIEYDTGIISPKPRDILRSIEDTHPALKKYLCSGYGTYLQKQDSSLAEDIMLDLFSRGICVLSVHDSFIVNASNISELYKSMRYHFYKRYKFYPNIK